MTGFSYGWKCLITNAVRNSSFMHMNVRCPFFSFSYWRISSRVEIVRRRRRRSPPRTYEKTNLLFDSSESFFQLISRREKKKQHWKFMKNFLLTNSNISRQCKIHKQGKINMGFSLSLFECLVHLPAWDIDQREMLAYN